MRELKPCPFCGSTDTRCHNFGDECNNCGSRVVFMDLSDLHGSEDRPNYNTRPAEDALRAELEKTQKALDLATKSISDITCSCPLDTHDLCVFDEDVCNKLPVGEWATCWKKYFLKKAGE